MKYDRSHCRTKIIRIERPDHSSMKLRIVWPEEMQPPQSTTSASAQPQAVTPATGVLWLHGGGYLTGFPDMVFLTRAIDLVRECGAVVVSPAYRISLQEPYPAALEDSYLALCYMKEHAEELGIREDQLMVGGESAGGGLTAALCLYARDHGKVNIAFQMPLYPMLDCEDTDSSRDNHSFTTWNTPLNHMAWKHYLRGLDGQEVPMYASPSRCRDYRGLPPAYTYVGDAEPFYCETLAYVEELQKVGIPAKVDVYPGEYHAFDVMEQSSEHAQTARRTLCAEFDYAKAHYFAKQPQ